MKKGNQQVYFLRAEEENGGGEDERMNACHLWFVDEIETSQHKKKNKDGGPRAFFPLRSPSLRDLNNLKKLKEK